MKKTIYSALFATAMLFATASAFAQVKIGTNPTTIGTNSNLEVEAADANKVIVNKNNGTVVIENTPSGAITDSIMTVDANGNVRAINANKLKQLLGASGSVIMKRTTDQSVPAGPVVIDLTSTELDEENGANLADNTITIKRAGVYTLSGITHTVIPYHATTTYSTVDLIIQKSSAGTSTWTTFSRNSTEARTGGGIATNTLTFLDNANVGDRYRLVIAACLCLSGNPNYTVSSASLYAFKNL